MAIASTPQTFNFGGRLLSGYLLGFSSRAQRRVAEHEYLKIAGGRAEDMDQGPQRLSVRLTFIGSDCAAKYADFASFIKKNPKGLLVHPIAGQYYAFCEGPSDEVNYSTALNMISVAVSWVESNLDAPPPLVDTPSASTAAQATTTQLAAHNNAMASLMGTVAVAQLAIGKAMAQVQSAADQIGAVDDAMATVESAVSLAVGTVSKAIDSVVAIQTSAQILQQNVANFVLSASDIFDGTNPIVALASQLDLLLGACVTQAQATEALAIAQSRTPAGAADAVGATEDLLASCYVLYAAVQQERPPVVPFTVPVLIDVVTLCTRLYPGANAVAMASVLLSLNRIPNPAAIPAGTVLQVPSSAS